MIDSASLWVYLGVFAALVAAGLGAPIPEELPIVTAGALVGHAAEEQQVGVDRRPEMLAILAVAPPAAFPATLSWAGLYSGSLKVTEQRGGLRWWIMLPICILGVVISDGLLYGIGRIGGVRLLEHRWVKRIVPSEKRQQIESNFHRYGVWVLLFARVLPGIRSPIFITAGIMRLSLGRFLFADGIYAIPGVTLLFTLAYWFGDQFRDLVETAEQGVQRLRPLLILLLIAVAAGFLLYHFMRRPVVTGAPEELPLIGDQVASRVEHTPKIEEKPSAPSPPSVDGVAQDGKQQDRVP
jgi:membrane protein DedA with SNARE-associated domain